MAYISLYVDARIPRGNDDRNSDSRLTDVAQAIQTVHLGQIEIQHDDTHLVSAILQYLHGFRSVGGLQDVVSVRPQNGSHDGSHLLIVFHNNDDLAVSRQVASVGTGGGRGAMLGGLAARQDNRHPSALPRSGSNANPPVVVDYDTVNDRHPQTRALSSGLGGEEGLENARKDVLGHAKPVVLHNKNGVAAGRTPVALTATGFSVK